MVEGAEAEPPVGPTKAAGVCGTLGTYGGENRRRGQGAGRRGGEGAAGAGQRTAAAPKNHRGMREARAPGRAGTCLLICRGSTLGARSIMPKGQWRARGVGSCQGREKTKPRGGRAGGGGVEADTTPHAEGTTGPSPSAAAHSENDLRRGATVAAAD